MELKSMIDGARNGEYIGSQAGELGKGQLQLKGVHLRLRKSAVRVGNKAKEWIVHHVVGKESNLIRRHLLHGRPEMVQLTRPAKVEMGSLFADVSCFQRHLSRKLIAKSEGPNLLIRDPLLR